MRWGERANRMQRLPDQIETSHVVLQWPSLSSGRYMSWLLLLSARTQRCTFACAQILLIKPMQFDPMISDRLLCQAKTSRRIGNRCSPESQNHGPRGRWSSCQGVALARGQQARYSSWQLHGEAASGWGPKWECHPCISVWGGLRAGCL